MAGRPQDSSHGRQEELLSIAEVLKTELFGDVRRPAISVGIGRDAVLVRLRARYASDAAQLHARFGHRLALSVGCKPYPTLATPIPPRRAPSAVLSPALLSVELHMPTASVPSGEILQCEVSITNRASYRLRVDSGQPLGGCVRRPGGELMAGSLVEAMAGTGWSRILDPDQAAGIQAYIGTASCLPDSDYLLPPGRYDALVSVPLSWKRESVGDDIVPAIEALVVVQTPVVLTDV